MLSLQTGCISCAGVPTADPEAEEEDGAALEDPEARGGRRWRNT